MPHQRATPEVREFARKTRKVLQMLQHQRGDWLIDSTLALSKLDEIISSAKISPPDCGRTHHLGPIAVVLDEDFKTSVDVGAPQTSQDSYVYWLRGKAEGKGVATKMMVLVHRPGWNLNEFLGWAKKNKLRQTKPRDVLAICKAKPDLNSELGMDSLRLHGSE